MAHFAVTAVGIDRPGIVAAVTQVFVDEGCNIEDSSMTILRGHFAMMLVVDAPQGVDGHHLESALAAPADAFDLVVTVRNIAEVATGEEAGEEGESWTVSVYGADHPGIVHSVAELLASLSVNIVDLSTRVIGGPEVPVYAMVMEVTLPPHVAASELGDRLEQLAGELEVSCSLHPSEADIL